MKRVLFVLSTLAISTFAASEIDVTRFSLFPRLSVQGNFGSSSLGYFVLSDMRYSTSYEKEMNGSVVDTTAREIWRNDLIVGPSWNRQITKTIPLSVKLLYHPMWNNGSDIVEKPYLRHSAEIQADLMHSVGKKSKMRYRIIAMNWFEGKTGEQKDLHNEFYTRLLVGGIIPINKVFQFIVDEEIFLKPTADDSDLDGTEFFNKNVVWAGGQWKPNPILTLKLQYVQTFTNQEQNSFKSVEINDPSVMLHAAISIPNKKGE